MVDGGKEELAEDISKEEGSSWIMRPPCSMSCWLFCMGRCGVGDAIMGWYDGCRGATWPAMGDAHHAWASWLPRSGVKGNVDEPRESECHEERDCGSEECGEEKMSSAGGGLEVKVELWDWLRYRGGCRAARVFAEGEGMEIAGEGWKSPES